VHTKKPTDKKVWYIYTMEYYSTIKKSARYWWFTPVILGNWEDEIRSIMV
jgi:hypothetical protein